ncbi:purine-nucleoside phosphorylase [Dermatobacter hominis]|uniref:purine-nucleoside phosphorylase n=1 Tax=Dermatobacter hominis TaxID=2884263 RepID=UPI001D127325|nr:purine-nucleoside phosphorylase [Dermatobacter hominis]UDY37713.1 purine-nucleoside phosphorylase [Dermatobacter hominis]
MTNGDPYALARSDADLLRDRLGEHTVAVVLGSGWAGVGAGLGDVRADMAMSDLAGVPAPTVAGHGGTASSVDVGGVRTLVLAGRSHLYEGHPPSTVVHAVRSAVLAGCTTVCLTNAAGSLRPDVGVGTPVVIADHLNLTGANPMCGPEPPGPPGSRFTDLTRLYSPRLREAAGPDRVEGVYAGLLGGSYETPAEIRMLRTLGADLVGMSTVLEAIAAQHLGAEVFGVSLVTNLAAGLAAEIDHGEVLAAGAAAQDRLADLLRRVVAAA